MSPNFVPEDQYTGLTDIVAKDLEAESPSSLAPSGQAAEVVPEQTGSKPSILDIAGASFRRDNTIGAVANHLKYHMTGEIEVGFNPLSEDNLRSLGAAGLGGYVDKFTNVANKADFETKLRKVQDEVKDLQIFQNAGSGGWLSSIGVFAERGVIGILDPINFVPVGGEAYKIFRGGSMLKGGLTRAAFKVMANGAARGAGVGLAAGAIQQIPLGLMSETRTAGEVAGNITAAGFLGLFLGGAGAGLAMRGGALGKAAKVSTLIDELAPKLEKDLTVPISGPDRFVEHSVALTDETVNNVRVIVGEMEKLKKGGLADEIVNQAIDERIKKLDPITGFFLENLKMGQASPSFRIAMRSSDEAKKALQKLVSIPFFFEKFKEGITLGPAAETAGALWNEEAAVALKKAGTIFEKYVKKAADSPEIPTKNRDRFFNDLTEAMFNGGKYSHTDGVYAQHVMVAAEELRPALKKALSEGTKVGLFSDIIESDPDWVKKYFHRIYDQDRIRMEEDKLASGRLIENDDTLRKRLTDFFVADGSPVADAKEKAMGIIENIVSGPSGRPHYQAASGDVALTDRLINQILDADTNEETFFDAYEKLRKQALEAQDILKERPTKGGRGPTKKRVLGDIPYETLKDYLVTDSRTVMLGYFKKIGADIEIARNFGTVDMRDSIKLILNEYGEKIKHVGGGTSAGIALKNEMRETLNDLEALRNIVRGTYQLSSDPTGTMTKSVRIAKNFLTTLFGGTFGLSAFQDTAHIVLHDGLDTLFSTPLTRVTGELAAIKEVNELAGVTNIIEHSLTRYMSASRFDMGAEFSNAMARRDFKALREVLKDEGLLSAVESMTAKGADFMYTANGVRLWDRFWRQIVGTRTQMKIVEYADKALSGGKLAAKELEEMAFLGISKKSLREIGKQVKQFGIEENGVVMANIGAWGEEAGDLRRAFLSAVRKAADTQIQRSGAGDLPFLARTQAGSLWLQLRTFGIVGMSNYLIPLSQRLAEGDSRAFSSLAVALAAITVSESAKIALNNISKTGKGRTKIDIATLAKRIATRADFLSYLGDINQTTMDAYRYMTQAGNEDRNMRKIVEDIGGVHVSNGMNVFQAARGTYMKATGRRMSREQESALWRMIPYQNLFRYRQIIQMAKQKKE